MPSRMPSPKSSGDARPRVQQAGQRRPRDGGGQRDRRRPVPGDARSGTSSARATLTRIWTSWEYFPGFRVSVAGSLLGLVYGAAAGFAAGWSFACPRNAAMAVYLAVALRTRRENVLRRLFDYI